MGEVVAIGRMSETEYDRLRAALGNRKDAKAKWDQEQCKLFVRSGWPTAALARKEAIHIRTMQFRLLFGRFLTFCERRTMVRGSSTLEGLTERGFRTRWTDTSGNEAERFLAVLKTLEGPPISSRSIPASELFLKLSPILDALKEYGERHYAKAYPPAIATQARILQALLDEWTK